MQARKLITAVKFRLFNLRPHLISRISDDDLLGPYSQVHGGKNICPRPVERPPDIVAFQRGSIPDAAVRIILASWLGDHALTSAVIFQYWPQWPSGGEYACLTSGKCSNTVMRGNPSLAVESAFSE